MPFRPLWVDLNKDIYSTYHDLATHNNHGRDYRIRLIDRHSPITILAPHAGGIEPGVSEIALAIALKDFNCYLFEGLRLDSNRDLHITSTRFDEPQCLELVQRSLLVVAVHGCEGGENDARVGGLAIGIRGHLVNLLCQAGFNAYPGLGNLSGSMPANLCNMGSTGLGVQIELTTGLRRLLFQDLDSRQGREVVTPYFATLTQTIRAGLLAIQSELSTLGNSPAII